MPPPPPVAFSMTGSPIRSAAAAASSTDRRRPVPGNSGTPAASARSRAVCLSPKVSICSGVGPIQVSPAASAARAAATFSDRNP
jgi:hypothetical protein